MTDCPLSHIPTGPTWGLSPAQRVLCPQSFFRKTILYGIFKKSTHKHTNQKQSCTYFGDLAKFLSGSAQPKYGHPRHPRRPSQLPCSATTPQGAVTYPIPPKTPPSKNFRKCLAHLTERRGGGLAGNSTSTPCIGRPSRRTQAISIPFCSSRRGASNGVGLVPVHRGFGLSRMFEAGGPAWEWSRDSAHGCATFRQLAPARPSPYRVGSASSSRVAPSREFHHLGRKKYPNSARTNVSIHYRPRHGPEKP